jgi:AcrR family transcriptional regulator
MKEKILFNASEMFLNFGFKSVTMDDIANTSGISKKQFMHILKIKQN